MLIGQPKPDPGGSPYTNTSKDYDWLSDCAKAARWLRYIPFHQIIDKRNDAPMVRKFEAPDPYAYLSTQIAVKIPQDVTPVLDVEDFRGVHPFRIVLVGEKSSLEPVLGPVARDFEADLYLPTGEMSETMAYQMSATAIEDGRPMVVLYFSDCDPAGWQMPISVARKLQAFSVMLGWFDFRVHRVALRPDQVADLGLPSTPLKETERRADRWTEVMGVEQTEIDALASLRPDVLDQIARQACAEFFDATLARRVRQYRQEWLAMAREMIAPALNSERIAEVRAEAERALAGMRQQVAELNNQLRVDVSSDDLPAIEIPEPDITGLGGLPPLIDSGWDFAFQSEALIRSKEYR